MQDTVQRETPAQETEELQDAAEALFTQDENETTVEAEGLGAALDETAGDFTVASFKCLCGLSHGHSTDKHVATEGANGIEMGDIDEMEMNPVCHCGAHEVAERADEFGVSASAWESTAGAAPVPQSVKRQLGR